MAISVSLKLDKEELIIETGELAKQANGAVLIRMGGTAILVPATASKKPVENIDFFPLHVFYQERSYAAGKIPGGFIKREGRPSNKEVLVSRLIDRPIRPLFPEGFRNEVQIMPLTLSADHKNQPDILAIIGASAALTISDIPFNGPIGAVRVGKINNQLVVNPSFENLEKSSLDLVVAGTTNGILMVEGDASELSEIEMVEALKFAHKYIIEIVKLQKELLEKVGPVKKMETKLFVIDDELKQMIINNCKPKLQEIILTHKDKQERNNAIDTLFEKTLTEYKEKYPEKLETLENIELQMKSVFEDIIKSIVRNIILTENRRIDGRKLDEIRDIWCKVGIFPRTHGSAVFTRGQTQSLGIVTLGSVDDEQRLDDIEGEESKTFMLHYNFPPFSVGETGKITAPSRREIGHGMLAERALSKVLPEYNKFPYTIRIVSEILESNGSSSMATVCSGTLAMLDAGIPIKDSVAGIAMGLIMEKDKYAILTDILGEEDHYGDMDFKIAGTKNGITAFQMDIKTDSIPFDIIQEALLQAKKARLFILEKMAQTIDKPRKEISLYAPRIKVLKIPKDKIAMVIGPGGSVIKDIIQKTDTTINIDDSGEEGIIYITGFDAESIEKALKMIKNITVDIKIGEVYNGEVKKITDFGVFVSLPGKKDGLVHISEISNKRIKNIHDFLKEGQEVKVKVLDIKPDGKIALSIKHAH